MATTKKTTAAPSEEVKKPVRAKAPAAAKIPAVAKAAPAKKGVAKKVAAEPTAKRTPTKKKVTAKPPMDPAQRANYVQVAAFYIAERRGFAAADPMEDWLAAEAEIDRLIASGHFTR
jgi:hypothetical protein